MLSPALLAIEEAVTVRNNLDNSYDLTSVPPVRLRENQVFLYKGESVAKQGTIMTNANCIAIPFSSNWSHDTGQ